MFRILTILLLISTINSQLSTVSAQRLASNPTKPGWIFEGIAGKKWIGAGVYADSASLPALPRAFTGGTGADSTYGFLAYTKADSAVWVFTSYIWQRVGRPGTASTTGGIYIVSEQCRDSIFSATDSSFLFYVQRTNGLRPGGGIVTHTTGYSYSVTAASYTLLCTDYSSRDSSLTLATAHPSLNRFDVIFVDTSGQAQVRTGTAAANPVVPQTDQLTEILLAIIEVNAGSTGPTIANRKVFDQDAAGEWNSHANSSGLTVNYTSSAQASSGSTSAEVSSVTTRDNYIAFIRPGGDSAVAGFSTLQFQLRMKAPLRTLTMYAYFASGGNTTGSRIGQQVAIPIGTGSQNTWETIVLNIADFGLATGAVADRLIIRIAGNPTGGNYSGYFIDDIRLLTGSTTPPPAPANYVQDIRRTADDVQQMVNGTYSIRFSLADKVNTGDTANMMRYAVRHVYRKAGTDSVFIVNGVGETFAFKDSIGGGSMVYPGAGIAVSNGSGWATSITDNSANWNTAFSWGNHASAGYLTSISGIAAGGDLTGTYPNPTLANTAVSPGSYTNANITVDAKGRITAASNGSGGGGGVTTVGTFSGSAQTNGATISGNTITFGPASATVPGMVSTGAQTWGGAKTFNGGIVIGASQSISYGTSFGTGNFLMYNGGASSRYGQGIASNDYQFFVPNSASFTWRGGGDYNGAARMSLSSTSLSASGISATFGSITTSGLITGGSSGISITGKITFNNMSNTTALELYNGGAGNRYGWGLPTNKMAFFVPNTASYAWQKGGDYNSGTSNDLMTLDAATGTLALATTNGGIYIPRLTRLQKIAISSVLHGLQVYDTDNRALWVNLNSSTTTWGALYAAQDTVATDASFTLPVYSSFVILPTITTGRTLTLPTAASVENKTIIIKVANSSANAWTVSPAIKDNTDVDVTTLTNDKVYTLFSDGTVYHIISLY